jgi:starch-binding outer membrane protein, SusD/RagB family
MKNKFLLFIAAVAALGLGSCGLFEVEDVQDLNNPTVESVLTDASRAQVNQLAVGVQESARNGYFSSSWCGGSVGREVVFFNKTDNRYYTELQGQVAIDPGGIFYPWYLSFNSVRRRAEIFYLSANNSKLLTPEQKKGAEGFAKTIQAYSMLNCLNMMGKEGIRTAFTDLLAVGDLLKPGKMSDYNTGLAYIKKLTDEGAAALDGAGSAFAFPITPGWGVNFDTPAEFKKFNRAVAARVAMYQKDWAAMNTAISASFFDLGGSLTLGPNFTYSTTPGDVRNPFFLNKNEATAPICPQSKFIAEAEAGDTRVFGAGVADGGKAKIRLRTSSASLGGFPEALYEISLVPTNTSPISIIRNEELILMYAEAQIQTDKLAEGEKALDVIRAAHGLKKIAEAKPAISGKKDGLIDELLNQRRYSLFMEGSHRWFDMRRYNRLNTLPLDLPTHKVIENFPKKQTEVDWDAANP